jgi:hypothetical protein
MSESTAVGEVVDRYNFKIRIFQNSPECDATDPTKSVDSDLVLLFIVLI